MGKDTEISWTHHTFNPWWGCQRVSEACRHCYAETFSHRLGKDLWGPESDRQPASDSYWKQPLAWDRKAGKTGARERVFCASMADVFEDREDLDVHRERLWELIENTTNLDWLLLTKRPENIARMLPTMLQGDPRVWLGATVEDQAAADQRVPWLVEVPAAVRFLSIEPMLGSVDLTNIEVFKPAPPYGPGAWLNCLTGHVKGPDEIHDTRISWVIVGGESGPGARPMHPQWARNIRDQCVAAGTPFHFKQWGAWAPWCECPTKKTCRDMDIDRLGGSEAAMFHCGKKSAGRELDGREWSEMPDDLIIQFQGGRPAP